MIQLPQDGRRSLVDQALDKVESPQQAAPSSIDRRLDEIAARRVAALRATMNVAQEIPSETAVRAVRMQLRTRLPMDYIERVLPDLEREEKLQGFNVEAFVRAHPETARWVSQHPMYAALPPEEIRGLGNLAQLMTLEREAWPMPPAQREEEARARARDAYARQQEFVQSQSEDRGLFVGDNPPTPNLSAIWPKSEEDFYKDAIRDINSREDYISGKDPIGFWERTRQRSAENPLWYLPFSGGFSESRNRQVLQAAAEADEKDQATPEQKRLLHMTARLERAAQRRGMTFLGEVGAIASESLVFAAELGAASPAFRAAKGTAELALRGALKRALDGGVRTAARRAIGTTAGVLAETAVAGAGRLPGEIASQATPDVVLNEDGGYVVLKGTGKSAAMAIPAGLYSLFVEYASERTGALFEAADRRLGQAVFGWWTAKNPGGTVDSLRAALRASGIHGVLGENFEEEVAKIMKAAGGVEGYEVTTARELAARSVAFALPGAAAAAVSHLGKRPGNPESFKAIAEALQGAPKLLETAPEAVESILKQAARGTGNERVYAPLQAWQAFAEGQKQDPRALAAEVLGSPEAYDHALETGADIPIPTEKAVTTLLKEHAGYWQNNLRWDPMEETGKEAEETAKAIEDDTQAREVEEKVGAILQEREPEIQRMAIEHSRREASAALEILQETDMIARLEREVGRRVYWSKEAGKGNAEELVKSGVPKQLIASPEEARRRGPTYATSMDEAAATLGLESDEQLVEALAAAAEGRKRAKDAIASEFVDDRAYQLVSRRERARAIADVTGDPTAFYDQAAAEVGEAIRTMLLASGRRRDVAESDARIAEAYFRTQGVREKIDPMELFQAAKLRIQQALKPGRGLKQPGAQGSEPPLRNVEFGPIKYNPDQLLEPVVLQALFSEKDGLIWRQAVDYWKAHYKNLVVENPSLGKVAFTRDGLGKNYQGVQPHPIRMAAVQALPELVQIAVPYSRAADRNARPKLLGHIYAVAPLHVEGKTYAVRLSFKQVKGTGAETFYYFEGHELEEVRGGRSNKSELQPELPFDATPQAQESVDAASALSRPADASTSGAGLPQPAPVRVGDLVDAVKSTRPLFQPSERDEDPRGSYVPPELTGGPTIINFFKKADESSFIHEGGHWFLDMLTFLAGRENASDRVKADLQTVLDWFGVKDLAAWKALTFEERRPYHEKWAEAFESYMKTGKAPSVALRGVFRKFMAWLGEVYKRLRGLAEPSPAIREVMDRMLATEAEIAEAAREIELKPHAPKALKMSAEDALEYQARVDEVQARAREDFGAKLRSELDRAQEAWYREAEGKVREEVTAEVDLEPVYVARSVLRNNTWPGGESREQDPIKLDMQTIVEQHGGKERLKKLVGMYAREGGISPDKAAEAFGFSSGDELLRALETAERREDRIERLVRERMESRYGRRETPAERAEKVANALENEAMSDLLAFEARKIAALTGRKATPRAKLTEVARKRIASFKFRDIKPSIYLRAQMKARNDAFDAGARGDAEAFREANLRELFNHELYRAAVAAREEAEDIVDWVGRSDSRPRREALGLAGHDYLAQHDAILESFDFRYATTKTVDRRKALLEWVNAREEQGEPVQIDTRLLDDANRKHYKDATIEELRAIQDALKNIEALARLKNTLLTARKVKELSEAAAEIAGTIIENSKGSRRQEIETRLPQDAPGRGVEGFLASHRKTANFFREMDGWKDGGTLWELFVRPMNDAGNAEAVAKEKAAERLKEIFAVYSLSDRVAMWRKKDFIPEIGRSLTKQARIMVALNWFNADNREKLKAGYKWSDEQVQAILDGLDERDWKFVVGVLEYIETFWPEIKSLHERVTGIAPEKVEGVEVHTRFGVLNADRKFGYFPLKYDDRQSDRASANAIKEAADAAMRGATIRATTKHGHRKERVKGVKEPIQLDFGVIFGHIGNVIHDLSHYEYLLDANRLLRHKTVQDTIRAHHGDIVYKQLKEALTDIAAGEAPARDAFEVALKWIRTGTSVSAMGWNLSTALMQPLGATQSIVRIGAKWFGRGLSKWLGGAGQMEGVVKMVQEKSSFMRLRAKTQMREINEVRNSLSPRGALGAVEDTYFWLITRMQMAVDVPTWLGAYEKAREQNPRQEGESEQEADARAIALADQAVLDSQGGGQIKDLAQIQRGGPLKKLWTQFYSYFNTTYNLTVESVKRTDWKNPEDVGRLAVDMLMLYTVPAVLGALLRSTLRGGGDDDDLAEKLASEQLTYLLGTIVGGREIAGGIQGFFNWEGPAGARGFAALSKLARQVRQFEADAGLWDALNESAGIFLHLPAGQLERTVRGFSALIDGETGNPLAPLVGPPRKR